MPPEWYKAMQQSTAFAIALEPPPPGYVTAMAWPPETGDHVMLGHWNTEDVWQQACALAATGRPLRLPPLSRAKALRLMDRALAGDTSAILRLSRLVREALTIAVAQGGQRLPTSTDADMRGVMVAIPWADGTPVVALRRCIPRAATGQHLLRPPNARLVPVWDATAAQFGFAPAAPVTRH